MSYSYGSHCWPPDFMPAVIARIADNVAGMTRDRVFQSLFLDDDHLKFPPADRFVTLYLGNFPVDQRMVTGGGIYNTAFDASMVVTAFCRLESDIENRSTQQLNDEVSGVYIFLQQIIAQFQDWEDGPAGADGLKLFRRPPRISPGFRIERKAGQNGQRWAVAPISFEVSFVANLGYGFTGSVLPIP